MLNALNEENIEHYTTVISGPQIALTIIYLLKNPPIPTNSALILEQSRTDVVVNSSDSLGTGNAVTDRGVFI